MKSIKINSKYFFILASILTVLASVFKFIEWPERGFISIMMVLSFIFGAIALTVEFSKAFKRNKSMIS